MKKNYINYSLEKQNLKPRIKTQKNIKLCNVKISTIGNRNNSKTNNALIMNKIDMNHTLQLQKNFHNKLSNQNIPLSKKILNKKPILNINKSYDSIIPSIQLIQTKILPNNKINKFNLNPKLVHINHISTISKNKCQKQVILTNTSTTPTKYCNTSANKIKCNKIINNNNHHHFNILKPYIKQKVIFKKQKPGNILNRSTDCIKKSDIITKISPDDPEGNYIIKLNEVILNRYIVKSLLGKGSFGQGVKCYDTIEKEDVCIKIIKNKKKFTDQSKIEIQILKYLNSNTKDNYKNNIVLLKDNFVFKNHICLVFELLSKNLYDILQENNFLGIELDSLRSITTQLLFALLYLKKLKIIHCDLKPENILLISSMRAKIKLIDFGSSCINNEKLYTYIQSRYYRAPEVLLGLNYDIEIDMWSLGCVLCELYKGFPIFPGKSEQEMIYLFMDYLGKPPDNLINMSQRKLNFFDKYNNCYELRNSKGKIRKPYSRKIENFLEGCTNEFIDFIKKCLIWVPKNRMKVEEALMHKFIIGNMNSEVKKLHIKKMNDILNGEVIDYSTFYEGEEEEEVSFRCDKHIPNLNFGKYVNCKTDENIISATYRKKTNK